MRNPLKCGFFYFVYRYLLLNNIKTMYKNFRLTDQERKEILEQHQSKGYKQPLKESTLENSVDEMSLTPDEVDENLGMLARIAAPMVASYAGSKMADTNEEDINELGGYIGDAPEKIDGPFMKEIDPSVYEDMSYLDAMKADILLMRLFHNDIISKDAFLEVRKPVDEIVKILKGGYFEKEKDLPF